MPTSTEHDHSHTYRTNQIDRRDPTQTITLRKRYAQEARGRWDNVIRQIREAVIENDVFGMRANVETPPTSAYSFPQDSSKVESMDNFIQQLINDEVLEPVDVDAPGAGPSEHWQYTYVRQASRKGIKDAEKWMKDAGFEVDEESVQKMFNRPIHAQTLNEMWTRQFEALKNIGDDTAQQIREELTAGFAQGQNPRKIAQSMTDRVKKIGKTRATQMARTEVIRTHAESTLDRYERAGVDKVTGRAEWVSAGDSRVCFPKNIKVETKKGEKNIQNIEKKDVVLTDDGYNEVTETQKRKHKGDFVGIKTDNGKIISTDDHEYYTLEKGYLRGSEVNRGNTFKSVNDKRIKVRDVINFSFSNSDDLPSFLFNICVLFRIMLFGIFMPIVSIDFKGYAKIFKQKIHTIASHFSLLDKINIKSFKRKPNSFFKSGFTFIRHITGKRTKLPFSFFVWANSKLFSALKAVNCNGGASTLFRTVPSVKAPFNIRFFNPKLFTTIFAFFVIPLAVFSLAFVRAIGVSMFDAFQNLELFFTSGTHFGYFLTSIILVTLTATILSITLTIRKVKFLFAKVTSVIFSGFTCLGITFMGTISVITFFLLVFIFLFKRISAMVTDKSIHLLHPLSVWSIFYQKLLKNKVEVYDFTVKNEHNFFANGHLVHNCPVCESLHGVQFSIKEARGMIPSHVNCRCTWVLVQRQSDVNPERFVSGR